MLRTWLLANTIGCLQPSRSPPAALRPGQAASVSVPAACTWSNTGVMMQPGETYELTASGTWKDGLAPTCGPEGYDMKLLSFAEPLRREPREKWFSLTGCMGKSEAECYTIGSGRVLRPRRAGVLHVFPNDVPGMYWNNMGAVTLRITRVA